MAEEEKREEEERRRKKRKYSRADEQEDTDDVGEGPSTSVEILYASQTQNLDSVETYIAPPLESDPVVEGPPTRSNSVPDTATVLDPIPSTHSKKRRRAAQEPFPETPCPEPVTPDTTAQTEPNPMDGYCVYPQCPSSGPEDGSSLDGICDAPTLATAPPPAQSRKYAGPFTNASCAILMIWQNTRSTRNTVDELDRLTRMLQHIDKSELKGCSYEREIKKLYEYLTT